MKLHERILLMAGITLLAMPPSLLALKTDRQQPLEVNADSTDGTLGDGMATLKGNVEIRQGSLLIQADIAEVEKVDGRVRRFELNGSPVHLQQEIENEGIVSAQALKIDYVVATGIVTLTGAADVVHPQYNISGEVLEYDMNSQNFKGSGGDTNGRIRIRMDPEVVPGDLPASGESGQEESVPADETGQEEPGRAAETGETG
jgi:lipopolysaccharide export system protein LptA